MEGEGNYVVLKHAVFRALVVSAACIVLGVIIFQNTVFIPTMRAFQFTLSGITAGISYAALKASCIRNGSHHSNHERAHSNCSRCLCP
jgi:hypothetical protein